MLRNGYYTVVEILIRKGARTDLVGRDGSALEQAQRILDEETFRKIENLVGRVVQTFLFLDFYLTSC